MHGHQTPLSLGLGGVARETSLCPHPPQPPGPLAYLHSHIHMYDTLQVSNKGRVVVLEEEMTVDELAERMKMSPSESASHDE